MPRNIIILFGFLKYENVFDKKKTTQPTENFVLGGQYNNTAPFDLS